MLVDNKCIHQAIASEVVSEPANKKVVNWSMISVSDIRFEGFSDMLALTVRRSD